MRYFLGALVAASAIGFSSVGWAQEPGWTGEVIASPDERAVLASTPIINRPYRPLHFYGNTVRRLHYHGRVLPTPQEMRRTAVLLGR